MTNDDGRKPEGAPERSPKAGAGAPSGVDWNGPKRFSVQRKMAIVARLLRSEPLELVARETNVSIARLTEWRDRALAGAVTALKERERDDRDDNRWLMFALPPEEDIDQTIADVRFVQPKADSCTATKRGIYSITYRRTRARAHSGNPAFRRPSINSFKCDCLRRPILADIVKAGSVSSRRAAASRASPSRRGQMVISDKREPGSCSA